MAVATHGCLPALPRCVIVLEPSLSGTCPLQSLACCLLSLHDKYTTFLPVTTSHPLSSSPAQTHPTAPTPQLSDIYGYPSPPQQNQQTHTAAAMQIFVKTRTYHPAYTYVLATARSWWCSLHPLSTHTD